MFVSGFTFIRNALKYDYPIVEAINSILPLCDEFIVAVGKSEDDTLGLIRSIKNDKIKIIETLWDDTLRIGGEVLAVETNKALNHVSKQADWCFYIQGDEVIHEKYLPAIREAMRQWRTDKKVEGLLLGYTHFYGSYNYTAHARNWYRNEIRIIRNDAAIRSYKDAQGFRKNGKKLRVKKIDAVVYHYGWVKPPAFQQAKLQSFNKYWHSDEWVKQNVEATNEFDYSNIHSLSNFEGTHPKVIEERINNMNWKFSVDPVKNKNISLKNRLLAFVEKLTGYRIGEYKNYTRI
jgi:hypothetical protein